MFNGMTRHHMLGIGLKESLEINSNRDYLGTKQDQFFTDFNHWYDSMSLPRMKDVPVLDERVYQAFISGEFEEDFYVELYHQALTWHRNEFNLSRVMLMLTHCRQLFIMIAEKKENHCLARALCHSIDLGQSIITDVYQLHETLINLRKKSLAEVSRMRRSFQLISADIPEDLVQAFIDHQDWKMRAYACALGEIEEGDFPFSTNDCRLGQWLNAGGIEKIPESERHAFNVAHEQVHRLGFLALKEAREQHPERIVEFLNEMEIASDEVSRVLLERIEDEFVRAANLDALTGLPNRASFDAQLTHNLALAGRYEFWIGLIVVDVDHFKTINDEFGHAFGDQVLVELATVIEGAVRLEDHVYRWGGEEFAVLALDRTDDGIKNLAERIRKEVEESHFCKAEDKCYRYTVSCGAVSFHPETNLNEKQIFELADEQLYKAKNFGRNQVSYITLE